MLRENTATFHADLRADVVIVGGGLAGIACATGLSNSGQAVVLLEETSSLGGRARSWIDRKSGDVIDIGPHLLLSEYANLRALLDQLGTSGRLVWQSEKSYGAHAADSRPHALTPPLRLLPGPANAGWSLRDKASNRAIVWLAMQLREEDVMRLDDMSAAELLQQYGVAPRLIEWFWAAMSAALLNVPLEQCSAGALMRLYAQLLGHRHYSLGFADCGLGDLYVPAALRSIMDAGGRVHLRARVVALAYHAGKVAGVVLDDGTRISALHCVLAVPPQSLARLLPARCRAQRPFCDIRAFEPRPHVSTYLWLDRKVSADRYWARAACGTRLNHEFHDLSNIRSDWAGRASVIGSNSNDSHAVENMTDEEIVNATLAELVEAVPAAARARVLHAVVNRIPMAIPCPAPGTEQRRPETTTAIPGLLLAGDWTRTQLPACMESAVRSGWLAAEEVWSAIGQPRRLAVPPRPPEGVAGLVHRMVNRARRANVGARQPAPALATLRLNEAACPDQTAR